MVRLIRCHRRLLPILDLAPVRPFSHKPGVWAGVTALALTPGDKGFFFTLAIEVLEVSARVESCFCRL